MSNRLLNSAWAAEGLTPSQKLLLVNLADHANAQAECWCGHSLIARETGLSERSVRGELPKIAVKGHLTIKPESYRASKGQSRFTYIVHPNTPANASAVTPANGAIDTGKRAFRHRQTAHAI
jgi:hypothetical protein